MLLGKRINRTRVDDFNAIKDLTEPFFNPNRYLMKLLNTLKQNDLWKERAIIHNQYRQGMRMLLRQFGGSTCGYIANQGEISICYDYSLLCPFNDRQPLLNRLIVAGLHKNDFKWLLDYHPRLAHISNSISDNVAAPFALANKHGRRDIATMLKRYDDSLQLQV